MKKEAALLLALCACESRYGSYFNIDGDPNEIRFDRVHLYFGNDPQTRPIGTPDGTAVMATAYTREFDPQSDVFDLPHNPDGSLPTETTYWLPVTEENRQLGYVAAVVYDRSMPDKPIGVGEWQDFSLEDNVVAKFEIELEKPPVFNVVDKLELWGNAPGCFAWQRQRDGHSSTIGVILPDDGDCDGRVAAADCNDACPPGTPLCSQNLTVCQPDPAGCALACQRGSVGCTPSVCLPAEACTTECGARLPTIEDRMACFTDPFSGYAQHHLDVYVHEDPDGQLCTDTMQFKAYDRACKNPILEWYDASNGYSYKVAGRSDGLCEIKMIPPPMGAPYEGDHHMLISFDPLMDGGPRWTALLGITGVANTNCDPKFETGFDLQMLQGAPFDCQ